MNIYLGSCHCQSVTLKLTLPKTIAQYSPRKCDCDFCMERDIRYLSDPQGKLYIASNTALLMQKQGSEQASFVTCSQCEDVVAAVIDSKTGCIGAANGTLMDDAQQLQSAITVSPKKLAADDKVARWLTVWQPVTIEQLCTTKSEPKIN